MPRILLLALCAALLATPAAFAQQNYPQKPIRYVVPFPAGGIADVFARIIGGRLTEAWGQPVVAENRAGAGGNIRRRARREERARRLDDPHGQHRHAGGEREPVPQYALRFRVLGAGRSPAAPEFPALAEALPGFEVNNWVGTFGPAGMPSATTAKLNSEILAVMRAPEVQQRLLAEGARFTPTTPAQFSTFVAAETAKWGKLIREVGIRAD